MLPPVAAPLHYRLSLTVDPAKDRFSGHEEIDIKLTEPRRSIFMHGRDIHVARAAIWFGGKTSPVTYSQVHKDGVAQLKFAGEVPAGPATLVFDYDAPYNQSLSGLYKVVDHGDAYAFTQFENTDARRAFPSFDEPGFKTPFDITVIAPASDKVVGNTPANAEAAGNGMTKWVFETTKPLPTYLVALAVGPLDIVDAGNIPPNKFRDHPLHLRGVTAKGKGARLKYALSLTPGVVNALESYYGIGFPYQKLDILAVPDFAAGAMENAGAVTFREQLLLMNDNAPLDQKRQSLTVQAHELAHQWFGDLVTPKWWDDIWLNESFATWMEYKISQTVRPKQDFALETLKSSLNVMRLDELPSARQIHNPVRNQDDIDNAFDDITYSKGGAVLSMFENYLGPETFQRGIHAYLTKFAFRNATAQDFIGTIAATTHHPEIVQAFNDFINQSHIPLMKTDVQQANGSAIARVTESMYLPVGINMPAHHWHVPMCVAADGKRKCQLAGPASATISLGVRSPKTVLPNDKGAGYYRYSVSETQWKHLIDNAAQLSPADRLTLFHNVNAALRAGDIPAADFYVLVEKLAPAASWDLLQSDHRDSFGLTDALHDLRVTGVLDPRGATEQQALVRKLFGPRFAQLGISPKPGEAASNALLRQYLAQLLVEEGRDPAAIAQLAKAATVYLKSGGRDLDGMSPELVQEAMRAGVMLGGPAFADQVIAALKKSDDEYFIQSAIYALAGSTDRAKLDEVLAMALTPTIRIGDLRYVLRYFEAEPPAKEALWNWFKKNFAAIEKRVSAQGMSFAADIQKFGCDQATKTDLVSYLGPKAKDLDGLPRTLKENEDRIDRCMAFKKAKGTEINAALHSSEHA